MKTFSKSPAANESRRTVDCAICGSSSNRPVWDCGSFGFVRCQKCGHHFQNPQPDPASLIDRYDEEYRDYEVENDRNFLDLMLKGLGDVKFFERIDTSGRRPSILDIGCATGALLEHTADLGFEVQGVEVCEPAARWGAGHRNVPIAVGTLETVDLPRDTYDVIHASHVIEHVPDPRLFLKQVRALAAPESLVVIVTPNTSGLQARLFGSSWRSAIADHVHLFSRRNLARLFRETGFQILAVRTWGGLGAGTAPKWLKRPVDVLAKRYGFGDVMLFLAAPLDETQNGPPIDS